MKEEKPIRLSVKSVDLVHAITVPGTTIAGEISIQPPTKHKDVAVSVTLEGVMIEKGDVVALIPMTNVKRVLFGKPSKSD